MQADHRTTKASPQARRWRLTAHTTVESTSNFLLKHTLSSTAILSVWGVLTLTACSTTYATGPTAAPDSTGPVCIEGAIPVPDIGKAHSSLLPTSQLWINVEIPSERIIKQINQQLPQPLAQEKDRPVGAPGNATFKVTHGTPRLKNEKTGIQLRLPVEADISVCKPFGGSCLRYGQCEPAFDARFSFQTLWDEHYRTEAPRGRITATRKCVIGLDVTSRIEKIAQDEVAVVERQLAKEWPDTNRLVHDAWRELKAPLEVADSTCMHFSPQKISYSQLKISDEGEALVGTLGLEGQLLPAKSCSTSQKLPSVPSPQSHEKNSEESQLLLPQEVSQQQIEQALRDSVSGTWGEATSNRVSVSDVLFGDDQVALLIRAEGEVCGNVWVWGHLTYQAAGNFLKLELDGHSDTGTREEYTAPFLNYLRTHSQIPLQGPSWVNAERAEQLVDEIKAKLPRELKIAMTGLNLPQAQVHVSESGYTVLHQVKARLAITDVQIKR